MVAERALVNKPQIRLARGRARPGQPEARAREPADNSTQAHDIGV